MFMPIIVGAVAVAFILVIISLIGPKGSKAKETPAQDTSALEGEIASLKEENASLKSRLQEAQQKETQLNEQINSLQSAAKPNENIEIIKAENATLKDTLMTKENQNKKLTDELNELKEKVKSLEPAKEEPAEPRREPEESTGQPDEEGESEEKTE
jgi:cell shape-determining protein MreC